MAIQKRLVLALPLRDKGNASLGDEPLILDVDGEYQARLVVPGLEERLLVSSEDLQEVARALWVFFSRV